MELSQLINPQFQTALRKLAAQDIPLRTAFALKGIIYRMNDELKKYNEVRSEILQRLGEKGEDGNILVDANNNVQLSEENAKLFTTEIESLITTQVDVGNISVKDLGDKCTMTTSEIMLLNDVIKE